MAKLGAAIKIVGTDSLQIFSKSGTESSIFCCPLAVGKTHGGVSIPYVNRPDVGYRISPRGYFNFNPQVFVDIADTLERKEKALQAHKSQVMKTNIEDLSIVEVARSSANFRGIQGRVKYAEAFHSLRLFINI